MRFKALPALQNNLFQLPRFHRIKLHNESFMKLKKNYLNESRFPSSQRKSFNTNLQ